MVWASAACAVLLVGCSKTRSKHGERCVADGDCWGQLRCADGRCVGKNRGDPCDERRGFTCHRGLVCFAGVCSAKRGQAGERCISEDRRDVRRCTYGLWCSDQFCRTAEEIIAREADDDKSDGWESDGGGPVRVVSREHRGHAVAGCRSDERLIGGGCEGADLIRDRRAGFEASDTIGAHWSCRSQGATAVTAFALCESVAER